MALVQLADVIVPEIYYGYMAKDTKENTRIFQSGIMQDNANLSSFLSGGGLTANVPFWKDLADATPNIASDATGDVATPGKLTAAKQIAIRNVRNYGWSAADLSGELAGSDPMARIRARTGNWWDRSLENTLIACLHGVFADNIANDSGDMVRDIGTDSASTATDAELVSAEAILDAAQTMGDASDDLSAIIMHSICYTRLAKQNLIDFVPDSDGKVKFPTYLGYRVIKSDRVKKVVGTNRTKYYTYLCGMGAVGWGESPVRVPVEVEREAAQGNGNGVETLWTRRQFCIHPAGFSFVGSPSAEFPTDTEFATATSWNRVVDERKQVPFAALITNG